MIIAVDPGKMTGWARLNDAGGFESGEQSLYATLYFIHETMKQGVGSKLEIVCEDFIFTRETLKKSRQMYSSEGIGALRFLTELHDVPFYIQTPAAAKQFSTDEKLKLIRWHRPGKGHANDAARHLLLHAEGEGLIDVRQFVI